MPFRGENGAWLVETGDDRIHRSRRFRVVTGAAATERPTAALVVIGDEVLSGRTRDGHTAYLGKALGEIGIALCEVRIVADRHDAIIKAVNALRRRYAYLFTTGGIGPTHDDITAEAIARAFGRPLVVHEEAFRRLERYYSTQQRSFNEARQRMARVPEGADLIENPVSIAPGFRLENVHVLAGIPDVMHAMFESLRPGLVGGAPLRSRTLGVSAGEGDLAEGLGALQAAHPEVSIGSYPAMTPEGLRVRIVMRSADVERLDQVFDGLKRMVTDLGASMVVLDQG